MIKNKILTTRKIGTLDIDPLLLQKDLKKALNFQFNATYSEFISGTLGSCALWNKSGLSDETLVSHYDGCSKKTPYAKQLSYICSFVEKNFNIDELKLARILNIKYNSVLIPHVDFLETEREFYRFHIPLQTDEQCFNSEESTVYQMKVGEVWYINASRAHSAASFSNQDRLHLVLDFDSLQPIESITKFSLEAQGIPLQNTIQREKITEETNKTIESFASIINNYNFNDIFTILIKLHFTKEVSANDVFTFLFEIVNKSKNTSLIEKTKDMYLYYMKERELSSLTS